jgi:hypothetical protein
MKMKSIFVFFILTVFVACAPAASTPNPNASMRPLSAILVSGPEFVGDSVDNITVKLETKIPVACAVVYGETTAYGNIATDMDMAGGGHTDHHPLLTNIKPDTVYHFRFQGSGADGTFYVSDDFTYRTPKASASAQNKPQGRNVALLSEGARIKGVSSNYGGGANDSSFGANNAIDGDVNTQWSSNGDGDKAWIEIDLGKEFTVNAVGFRTRTMGSSAQIQQFRVLTDKGETLGPFDLADASQVYYFPVNTRTQTLRFEVVKSSGGNTGAAEIEVYAAP